MSDFFNMGGYAFYIWISYGLTAIILIANIVVAKLGEKQVKRELVMRIDREIEHENQAGENDASGS